MANRFATSLDSAAYIAGGLPYHGGPGNNYVTHAISAMVEELRERASTRDIPGRGMVCANGGFLTKHAVGIYSVGAPARLYRRRDPREYENTEDHLGFDAYTYNPNGIGRIIGWTVEYVSRPNKPSRGIIIGEMVKCNNVDQNKKVGGDDTDDDNECCEIGQRFVAVTDDADDLTIQWLLSEVSALYKY